MRRTHLPNTSPRAVSSRPASWYGIRGASAVARARDSGHVALPRSAHPPSLRRYNNTWLRPSPSTSPDLALGRTSSTVFCFHLPATLSDCRTPELTRSVLRLRLPRAPSHLVGEHRSQAPSQAEASSPRLPCSRLGSQRLVTRLLWGDTKARLVLCSSLHPGVLGSKFCI